MFLSLCAEQRQERVQSLRHQLHRELRGVEEELLPLQTRIKKVEARLKVLHLKSQCDPAEKVASCKLEEEHLRKAIG